MGKSEKKDKKAADKSIKKDKKSKKKAKASKKKSSSSSESSSSDADGLTIAVAASFGMILGCDNTVLLKSKYYQ